LTSGARRSCPGVWLAYCKVEGSVGEEKRYRIYHVSDFGRAPGEEEEDVTAPELCVLVGGDAGGALALFDDGALLNDGRRHRAGDGEDCKSEDQEELHVGDWKTTGLYLTASVGLAGLPGLADISDGRLVGSHRPIYVPRELFPDAVLTQGMIVELKKHMLCSTRPPINLGRSTRKDICLEGLRMQQSRTDWT